MNILAFDTSTELLSVCANQSEVSYFGAMEHAERIIPLIAQALNGAKIELKNVDAFVIGAGPGSFTGLRVGFATLQGFAIATDKPCYSIPSLDATAYAGRNQAEVTAVVMDARRDRVYLGIYQSGKRDYSCVTPDEAAEKLKALSKSVWITGNGLAKYAEVFQKNLPKSLLADESFWYPHSSKLIEIYNERKSELKPVPVNQLLPLYLQDPHIGPAKVKIQR